MTLGSCCSSDDQVLLLLRSSKHNNESWGLPGGNVEDGDLTFMATAEREATEEMGPLPAYTITASILTRCACFFASLPALTFWPCCCLLVLR